MQKLGIVVVVALAYLGLAALSSALAYAPSDAWTVWLASGLTLGLLLRRSPPAWAAPLAGAALGAGAFALWTGGGNVVDAVGYAAIEAVSAIAGAFVAARIAPLPNALASPRELGAFVAAALVASAVGAGLAAAWTLAAHSDDAVRTLRVWALGNAVGAVLVAPVVVTWSAFRVKRSGGLTMPEFAAGAIAAALFLGALALLFSDASGDRFGSGGAALTYPPVLFVGVVALTWGARGASLAAFAGALIALAFTVREAGPFANAAGALGETELHVQGYIAVLAITGLLISALNARTRLALAEARAWRTRFEAAIDAHRLVAYEWDPVGGAFVVTGDTQALCGVPAPAIRTLADWLAHVAADERDDVGAAFALRGDGSSGPPLAYRMRRPDGTTVALLDEAEQIRDHDGALHRVTGLVRVQTA